MIFNLIQVEALFFFVIGSSLALADKLNLIMMKVKKNTAIAFIVIWLSILVVKTIICGVLSVGGPTLLILVLYKVSIIVGIFAVWYGLDFVMEKKEFSKKILKYSPHTFFIFCFHEPLLDFVIQYTLINIADNTLFNLVTFIIYPTLAIMLAILVSKVLIKYLPVVHNILTGNRGTREI